MNTETQNRWTLQGKKALVTGATKGIGLVVAEEFLSLGAEVLIVARRSEDVENQLAAWRERERYFVVARSIEQGAVRPAWSVISLIALIVALLAAVMIFYMLTRPEMM